MLLLAQEFYLVEATIDWNDATHSSEIVTGIWKDPRATESTVQTLNTQTGEVLSTY